MDVCFEMFCVVR